MVKYCKCGAAQQAPSGRRISKSKRSKGGGFVPPLVPLPGPPDHRHAISDRILVAQSREEAAEELLECGRLRRALKALRPPLAAWVVQEAQDGGMQSEFIELLDREMGVWTGGDDVDRLLNTLDQARKQLC